MNEEQPDESSVTTINVGAAYVASLNAEQIAAAQAAINRIAESASAAMEQAMSGHRRALLDMTERISISINSNLNAALSHQVQQISETAGRMVAAHNAQAFTELAKSIESVAAAQVRITDSIAVALTRIQANHSQILESVAKVAIVAAAAQEAQWAELAQVMQASLANIDLAPVFAHIVDNPGGLLPSADLPGLGEMWDTPAIAVQVLTYLYVMSFVAYGCLRFEEAAQFLGLIFGVPGHVVAAKAGQYVRAVFEDLRDGEDDSDFSNQ